MQFNLHSNKYCHHSVNKATEAERLDNLLFIMSQSISGAESRAWSNVLCWVYFLFSKICKTRFTQNVIWTITDCYVCRRAFIKARLLKWGICLHSILYPASYLIFSLLIFKLSGTYLFWCHIIGIQCSSVNTNQITSQFFCYHKPPTAW